MQKMFNYQVFLQPPLGFVTSMEAAGCYISCCGKILMIKRQSFKTQGDKWGVPAGKLETGEAPPFTIVREMKEEVGLTLTVEKLQKIKTLYIRLPSLDYIFHMYATEFSFIPEIVLDLSENQEARWTTIQEALQLPLVAAGKEALLYYKSFLALSKNSLSPI